MYIFDSQVKTWEEEKMSNLYIVTENQKERFQYGVLFFIFITQCKFISLFSSGRPSIPSYRIYHNIKVKKKNWLYVILTFNLFSILIFDYSFLVNNKNKLFAILNNSWICELLNINTIQIYSVDD